MAISLGLQAYHPESRFLTGYTDVARNSLCFICVGRLWVIAKKTVL